MLRLKAILENKTLGSVHRS